MNRWETIRQFYRWAAPFILAEDANEWGIDPYEWTEAGIVLTPIEQWLWHDIRQHDAVLYPQFPVGRFFVDFANPKAKVAIECDGSAFHQDKARDAARDARLRDRGWSVYRITGSDCRDGVDGDGTSRASLFIAGICQKHGISRIDQARGRSSLRPASDYIPQVLEMFTRGDWRSA